PPPTAPESGAGSYPPRRGTPPPTTNTRTCGCPCAPSSSSRTFTTNYRGSTPKVQGLLSLQNRSRTRNLNPKPQVTASRPPENAQKSSNSGLCGKQPAKGRGLIHGASSPRRTTIGRTLKPA